MFIKEVIYCLFLIGITIFTNNFSYAEEDKSYKEVIIDNKNLEETKNQNNLDKNYNIITQEEYLKSIDNTTDDTMDDAVEVEDEILKQLQENKPFIYSHMPSNNPMEDKLTRIMKKQTKANSLFIELSVLGLGYNMQQQINKGDYNEDVWLNGKNYNSKAFDLNVSYGLDYAFLRSKFFNPLIGVFVNVSLSDLFYITYNKTVSTTDEEGLKTMFVSSSPRVDVGIKLGDVILTDSKNMIIPYITAGYSYRNEELDGNYKVKPYERISCRGEHCSSKIKDNKTYKIDSFSNHFVFVGAGIDYNILIFKIGLYAKLLYPLNNILLTDNERNIVNFGKRLIFSTGVNIGISIPIIL